MNNNKKGITHLLPLILVGVLLVGGVGASYYFSKNSNQPLITKSTVENIPQDQLEGWVEISNKYLGIKLKYPKIDPQNSEARVDQRNNSITITYTDSGINFSLREKTKAQDFYETSTLIYSDATDLTEVELNGNKFYQYKIKGERADTNYYLREIGGNLLTITSVLDIELENNILSTLEIVVPTDADTTIYRQLDNLGSAPELSGITNWFNSGPFSLEELKGNIVLLSFGRLHCEPCNDFWPYLELWKEKYSEKGVIILNIQSPKYDQEKDIRWIPIYLEQNSITVPVGLDLNHETFNSYESKYQPKVFLIDKTGNIRGKYIGAGGFEKIEEDLNLLLNEKE